MSRNAISLIGAERVIYNVNGLPTSFSEMMGLPDGQLDNTYWMPWYNNVDLDTQLRFGNVSNTPGEVHLWIGGQEKTSGCTPTPANVPYPYVLAVGASLRVSCPGVNNGPVKIISDVNIVAAERVIYNVNGLPTSFTEMKGLPDGQLDNTYWMPWYNNVDLDTQLRFGNVSNTPATVRVWIGTQEMTTGCNPSNVPYPYVLVAREPAGELSKREQWSRENRQRCEYRSRRAGDLQCQWLAYQFFRDDGTAQSPVGQYLLDALVQQCGSGYTTPIWKREQHSCHRAVVHRGAGDNQWLYAIEHSVSVCS